MYSHKRYLIRTVWIRSCVVFSVWFKCIAYLFFFCFHPSWVLCSLRLLGEKRYLILSSDACLSNVKKFTTASIKRGHASIKSGLVFTRSSILVHIWMVLMDDDSLLYDVIRLEKVSIGHGCPRQMPFRKRVYM